MEVSTKEKLKIRIENHLRKVARHLITFDSVHETLNYLLEAFYKEYACDLVAVLLNEKGRLVLKVWIGDDFTIYETLHLNVENCSPQLLQFAIWGGVDKKEEVRCDFHAALRKEELSTWFTVPLKNDKESFGLCIIGYREFVPLVYEADQIFTEFGHDVASAMELAMEKERQKRKMRGIEWIKKNILPTSSISQIIENTVERACRGTQASGACVYMFDEEKECFNLTPPLYGNISPLGKIQLRKGDKNLESYFPCLEVEGGDKLTVPLVVNLRTIGVLHVVAEEDRQFLREDVDFLKFVSEFVSMQIENARLYKFEHDSKKQLEMILEHQQELVKKTAKGEDIFTITKTISQMLDLSIYLFDRFMKLVTSWIRNEERDLEPIYERAINEETYKIMDKPRTGNIVIDEHTSIIVRPIKGGQELYGYVMIPLHKKKLNRINNLMIDYVLNVYAIEFVKQKLVLDAKEQVRESFISQLVSQPLKEKEKLIQYATLTNWNILEPHRVGVLSFRFKDEEIKDIVKMESERTRIWDDIKISLKEEYPNLVLSRKDQDFIIIVNRKEEGEKKAIFWENVYKKIKRAVDKIKRDVIVTLGIGGETESITDYYISYSQATKAKNVLCDQQKLGGVSFYDDLGSYTILNNIDDVDSAQMFVMKKLGPLLEYSQKNNVDLFSTLKVYLQNNGNLREASNELYIHRSTLEYRIERIEDILNVDLDSAEVRFEFMMAFKLYSLFGLEKVEKIT